MAGIDTSKLSRSDIGVALPSLLRRWRSTFALAADDQGDGSPVDGNRADEPDVDQLADEPDVDELARRMGPDGRSAADWLADTVGTLSLFEQSLQQAIRGDDSALHPAVLDPANRTVDDDGSPVDAHLDRLDSTVQALLAHAESLQSDELDDRRTVAGSDQTVSLLWLLQQAVAVLSDHLPKAAKALHAARR